jgi:hypothetical protein
LRGDGHGNFTAVPPDESGLIVPRDGKAAVAFDIDGDGWPDFLVSRNNDTTLAFQNHGGKDRHALCISLRGPVGNPTALGARITVELRSGAKQTAEIYGGSSYYSQSTAAVFFGYPDRDRPVRVHVRWPDGEITTHPVTGEPAQLRLSKPGP